MKTRVNNSNACKVVTVFLSLLSFCAVAIAQPNMKEDNVSYKDAEQAFIRLDAFMNDVEQSIRYVAPGDENAELEMVWKRLEVFADHCEREVRYRAPETDIQSDYATGKTNLEDNYNETADVPTLPR
jgi:hypothetical protein